jgi:hypothetical protein
MEFIVVGVHAMGTFCAGVLLLISSFFNSPSGSVMCLIVVRTYRNMLIS